MQNKRIVTVEDLDGVTIKLKGGKVTAEAATTGGGAPEWGIVPITVKAKEVQTVPFKRSYTNVPTVILSIRDATQTRFVWLRDVTNTKFSFSGNYLATNQTLHYVVYSND